MYIICISILLLPCIYPFCPVIRLIFSCLKKTDILRCSIWNSFISADFFIIIIKLVYLSYVSVTNSYCRIYSLFINALLTPAIKVNTELVISKITYHVSRIFKKITSWICWFWHYNQNNACYNKRGYHHNICISIAFFSFPQCHWIKYE